MVQLGWRKLSAWFLIYALVVVAVVYGFHIEDNAVDVIKWVTAFFFGANVAEHVMSAVDVKIGAKQ